MTERPVSPPSITSLGSGDPPAYLSNGWVGLAIEADPLIGGRCVVNGVATYHQELGHEVQAFCPYPLGVELRIGGDQHQLSTHFRLEQRDYDFLTGELRTQGSVQMGRHVTHLDVTTWCCRSLPCVVAQEIRHDGSGSFAATIDTSGAVGAIYSSSREHLGWQVPTGQQVGYATWCEEQPGRFIQMTAVVPSGSHPRPDLQAQRMLQVAVTRGFERLREENRREWANLWNRRVEAPFPEGQAATDAAFFYLNTSIHPSSPHSTGLFGLCPPTRYHNFSGHLFWDLETHALPALLHTQPEAAKALLEARFRGLESAKQNAAMHGYRGAMFPWEAGTSGQEELPVNWPKMLFEQHVSLCVAETFGRAAEHLGDDAFFAERAWPVLRGVAEWIVSRVELEEDGAHIRGVIGIDEGLGPHDDSIWTNISARRVLRMASAARERMGYSPSPAWRTLAESIVVPCEGHALLPHAGWRDQGQQLCPDMLMVLFPLQEPLPPEVMRATLERFLPRAESTLGMPMHSPYQWVWARILGDETEAKSRYQRGVLDFSFGPYHLIDEFGASHTKEKPRVGPYLAHCGAILNGALHASRGDGTAT